MRERILSPVLRWIQGILTKSAFLSHSLSNNFKMEGWVAYPLIILKIKKHVINQAWFFFSICSRFLLIFKIFNYRKIIHFTILCGFFLLTWNHSDFVTFYFLHLADRMYGFFKFVAYAWMCICMCIWKLQRETHHYGLLSNYCVIIITSMAMWLWPSFIQDFYTIIKLRPVHFP